MCLFGEAYFSTNKGTAIQLGDNCIQNFHLARYIVGYTIRNLVLRRHVSGAVNVISEHLAK